MTPNTTHDADTFSIRHRAEDAAALFPALLLDAERIAQTVASGLHGRRRAGPGETFWQHRPYAFGDSVSAIDWRQSARIADRLYIRQNEWEAAAAAWLWCDASPSMAFSSSSNHPRKDHRATILATALAILLSQAGERVGVLAAGDHDIADRPYQGRTAPARVLERLQGQSSAQSAPSSSTPLQPGARVVFMGDFYTNPDAIDAAVSAYANNGAVGAIVQICDPAEEDFPFTGRVEFSDLESQDRLVFGDTRSLQTDYKQAFQAHRARLETIASKSGWSFIAHRTDKPPQTALLALFTALGDARLWM